MTRELGGELADALKADGVRHLCDAAILRAQQLAGRFNAMANDIPMRTQARRILEQSGEVVNAQAGEVSELMQRHGAVSALVNAVEHSLQAHAVEPAFALLDLKAKVPAVLKARSLSECARQMAPSAHQRAPVAIYPSVWPNVTICIEPSVSGKT